jgi:hypothetical protein
VTEPVIVLAPDAERNGLATMLASLVRQNLDDRPDKRASFARLNGRVAIVAEDIGVTLTLCFEGGRLVVHDGLNGIPDVTVRAPSEEIMKLSLVELGRRGLPDPRGAVAREMFRASLSGRIKVHGALGHLPLLMRLTRVMSVC